MQSWQFIIGIIILSMAVLEIIRGEAFEKTGFVSRKEAPGSYWFSVICKIGLGIVILNLRFFQELIGR